ncbi:MAG: hypothetical protein ACFFCO_10805, partial [Promethearchaeota archaeon]
RVWELEGIDREYRFPLDFGEIKNGKQIAWIGLALKTGKSHIRTGKVDGFSWGWPFGVLYDTGSLQNRRLVPKPGVWVYSGRGAIPRSAFAAVHNKEVYFCIAKFTVCTMAFMVRAGSVDEARIKTALAARLEIRDPETGQSKYLETQDITVHLIENDYQSSSEYHDIEYMEIRLMDGGVIYVE